MSERNSKDVNDGRVDNSRRSFLKGSAAALSASGTISVAGCLSGEDATDTIKVAAQMPLSGVYETRGTPMMNATELAVKQVNENGGIDGREMELVTRDNQSDPGVGAEQARELILQENILINFGGMASSMRNAVLPVHADNNVPYFYPTSYEGGVCREIEGLDDFIDGINIPAERLEWGFFSGATPNQELDPFVSYLSENVTDGEWYLVGADYLWPHAMHTVLKNHFVDEAGIEVVGETYAPPAHDSWESTIEDIQQVDPDLIYMSLNDGAIPFLNQAESLGLTDEVEIASSSMTTPLANAIGSGADEVYASHDWMSTVDNEASNQFMDNYESEFGTGSTPSNYAESCYNQVIMTAEALREYAPDATSGSEVKEALENELVIEAPQGTVAMDPGTHHCYLNSRVGQYDAEEETMDILQTVDNVEPYGLTVEQDCLL